jgi:hypothetical protein
MTKLVRLSATHNRQYERPRRASVCVVMDGLPQAVFAVFSTPAEAPVTDVVPRREQYYRCHHEPNPEVQDEEPDRERDGDNPSDTGNDDPLLAGELSFLAHRFIISYGERTVHGNHISVDGGPYKASRLCRLPKRSACLSRTIELPPVHVCLIDTCDRSCGVSWHLEEPAGRLSMCLSPSGWLPNELLASRSPC